MDLRPATSALTGSPQRLHSAPTIDEPPSRGGRTIVVVISALAILLMMVV